MSDKPTLGQVHTAIRNKFPGLPTEAIEWVAGKLFGATEKYFEADPDSIGPAFYTEVEKALRAGENNAVLLAMASIRKIGE